MNKKTKYCDYCNGIAVPFTDTSFRCMDCGRIIPIDKAFNKREPVDYIRLANKYGLVYDDWDYEE